MVYYFQKQYLKVPAKLRFCENRKAENQPQPGHAWSKARWKLWKLEHFQNVRTKKRKLIYSSSLQDLLHNSQSFFQALFYLDLGFLSGSYTPAKKVMFRALMTPRIHHISEGYSIKGIHIQRLWKDSFERTILPVSHAKSFFDDNVYVWFDGFLHFTSFCSLLSYCLGSQFFTHKNLVFGFHCNISFEFRLR